MSYEGSNIGRDAMRARIECALTYVDEMVAERDDGEAYLPILLRLEEELAALAEKDTAVERAKRRATARR